MNTLAIVAHPDDLEVAAGGTVARMIEQRERVMVVVVGDAWHTGERAQQRDDALRAAIALGLRSDDVHFLEQRIGTVRCDDLAILSLRRLVDGREFMPDIVITHTRHDRDSEHRIVRELAMAAVPEAAVHLGMGVADSVDEHHFNPSLFIDTAQQMHRKVAALACFASGDTPRRIRSRELAEAIDAMECGYASSFGRTRVEAFETFYGDHARAARMLADYAITTPPVIVKLPLPETAIPVIPARPRSA